MAETTETTNDLVLAFLKELEETEEADGISQKGSQDSNVSTESVVFEIGTIDLKDAFSIMDIINPAAPYSNDDDVVRDLGRVVRYMVEGSTFIYKSWSSATSSFENKFVPKNQMKQDLMMIKLSYGETDWYSVWHVFEKYFKFFTVMGTCFSKEDQICTYNFFRGWYYGSGLMNSALLKTHIQFIFQIICDGQKNCFDYMMGWIATILQNVGSRTEACVVLKGDEGIGKNHFTNMLCEIFKGYSLSNMDGIGFFSFYLVVLFWTGKFNEIIRGKVLLVLNEKENEKHRGGKLWTLITEDVIQIEVKYKNASMDSNNCNFIISTNNKIPVKISPTDRRFFVLEVSDRHIKDFEYFGQFKKELTVLFFFCMVSCFFLFVLLFGRKNFLNRSPRSS
jgi:hypothetical protein